MNEEKKEILIEAAKSAKSPNGFQRFLAKIGAFFAVNNDVNENTVMGLAFSVVLIIAVFDSTVTLDKFGILAGLVAGCFALNLKK